MAADHIPTPRALLTPLLATLHTLYPNVLLPALDLLDRRLVTRIIPVHNDVAAATATGVPAQPDALIGEEREAEGEANVTPGEEKEKTHEEPNFFYLVRSAQQPSRRGRRAAEAALNEGGGGAGPTYVVQTRAWNCSCAAFAFSAFPAETVSPVYRIISSSSSSSAAASSLLSRRHNAAGSGQYEGEREQQLENEEEDDDVWEFGGMSRDGLDPEHGDDGVVGTGGVPCCKHLLACVLAERWTDVLGTYVAERRAGKEEAAGLVAAI
ncbi:hypothetical protein PG994_001451 [Apiospora phragmitis]|uniref:SWIM-type domain-containing protein n=1 Tax=Apiospora phragmitis TaxID=2905665 RepID=A0ABR1WTN6_9PEZI